MIQFFSSLFISILLVLFLLFNRFTQNKKLMLINKHNTFSGNNYYFGVIIYIIAYKVYFYIK